MLAREFGDARDNDCIDMGDGRKQERGNGKLRFLGTADSSEIRVTLTDTNHELKKVHFNKFKL